ncbi:hypothetical protein [Arundinibacter roseus]|uniref:Uncharacterized protein n=1 Tax=Arundinibacter roseus TaxID=2070510 RepID=A0A4R4KH09_9BACT|nr:hypothetical protein [Arundinibacter roseus]TDB67337.1 hypothetical protein EZE20_05140 [Arundinibacter roseus]
MSIEFEIASCQTQSDKKIFGLCDNPGPAKDPAYIDELDGAKWIAVVENENRHQTTFTAIDNCIEIKGADGKMEKRCDGMLTYNSTVIFVELKQRGAKGNSWVEEAELQLKNSIKHFEKTEFSESFNQKKAYISNSEHPKFKISQIGRMEKFFRDTEYILRIEARIKLV